MSSRPPSSAISSAPSSGAPEAALDALAVPDDAARESLPAVNAGGGLTAGQAVVLAGNPAVVPAADPALDQVLAGLAMAVARRRNFAIISHPDAGKTTLTE